jgi:hypothetical protein
MASAPAGAYPARFFEAQLAFARRVAEITAQSFAEAALQVTALYRILGLDPPFDPAQPIWSKFANLLEATTPIQTLAGQVRAFYLARFDQIPQMSANRHWGCFAFDQDITSHHVRLHFSQQDKSGLGPLSRERMAVRLAELRAMFGHIHETVQGAQQVRGGSWLYNREAYTRLFPPSFGASAEVDRPHYQFRGLWGQFLRFDLAPNDILMETFLERVKRLHMEKDMASCFPYQSLITLAPLNDFYSFYELL